MRVLIREVRILLAETLMGWILIILPRSDEQIVYAGLIRDYMNGVKAKMIANGTWEATGK